ncbi:MAG: hypothetical protein Q8M19_18390 [Reyranella sp.]|nr:hypothetical protein [Reyranella sp.]
MPSLAKCVAVTGLHRGENPQSGAPVAASLRGRFPDLRIVGLSYDPMESGHYSPHDDRLDATYLVPYPKAGPEALLDRLDTIAKKDPIDVVIPCLDSELPNFIKIRPELIKRGIRCAVPTAQAFAQRSKENLQALCRRIDVPTPQTRASNDPAKLASFVAKIGYPAFLKGRFYEAHLVHSPQELYHVFNELMTVWGGPVLAQEMTRGEEYNVAGIGDGKGAIVGSCSIRKMLRTRTGKGFAGVVVADPALNDLASRIVDALRWNGPFELEFVKAAGGRHMLFEMNPRFPAWIGFPSQVGYNLPARLLERLLEVSPSPLRDCVPGQMFVRHSIDLVGNISDLAQLASAGERAGTTVVPESVRMS